MVRAAFLVLVAFALAVPASRISAREAGQHGPLRTGIDLVALTVTVTDSREHQISGLSEHDFVVTEDGVPQPLSFFASTPLPLDLGIVLDTSGSMKRGLKLIKDAACGLARTLRPGDRGAVVEVKTGTSIRQPLTEDIARIEKAIHETTAGGRTGLYDSLYVVLQEFTRERRDRPEMRRQALVVLSDGADNASHMDFERVLDLVQRAGVSVYVISPKSATRLTLLTTDAEYQSRVQFSMNALVRDSGGRLFPSVESVALHRVYETIAAELANQYELAYVPSRPATDGRFRRVAVQVVSRPDVQARSRAGYFAATAAGSPWSAPGR